MSFYRCGTDAKPVHGIHKVTTDASPPSPPAVPSPGMGRLQAVFIIHFTGGTLCGDNCRCNASLNLLDHRSGFPALKPKKNTGWEMKGV